MSSERLRGWRLLFLAALALVPVGNCMSRNQQASSFIANRLDQQRMQGAVLLKAINFPSYLSVMLSKKAVEELHNVDTFMMAFCEKVLAREEPDKLREAYITYRDTVRPRIMAVFPDGETFCIAEALLARRNMEKFDLPNLFEEVLVGNPKTPLRKSWRRHKGARMDENALLARDLYADRLGPGNYNHHYTRISSRSEADANLENYVGSGYKAMNKLLRYGIYKESMSAGTVGSVKDAIMSLNSKFYPSLERDPGSGRSEDGTMQLYRITNEPSCRNGVMSNDGRLNYGTAGFLAKGSVMENEELWIEKAFLSTSSFRFSSSRSDSFEDAVRMSHCGTTCNTIYEITGRSARDLRNINSREREYLFRPGAVFRVTHPAGKPSGKSLRTLSGDGSETTRNFCIVYLEEISSTEVEDAVEANLTRVMNPPPVEDGR